MLAKATICNQTIQRNDMIIICINMILQVMFYMSDFSEVEQSKRQRHKNRLHFHIPYCCII